VTTAKPFLSARGKHDAEIQGSKFFGYWRVTNSYDSNKMGKSELKLEGQYMFILKNISKYDL
jgi:hypothetical protein